MRVFLAALLGLTLLGAPALQAQGLEGKYVAVGTVPAAHSLDVVVVEEYLNFTCPHCNNFRDVAKPVFKKYGKRIKLLRMPILFRGQADPPLRLFFVAQANGKEDLAEEALFDAAFKSGVNIYDPAVVNFLARNLGLSEAYRKDGDAQWVSQKIDAAAARASTFGVEGTPTLVLQSGLRLFPESTMQAFVDNFDHLVLELLKRG